MFSNITEAWSHDPVKEMTEKLSKGTFQTNIPHSEIFNFKNQSNLDNQNKTSSLVKPNELSLSEGNSLSVVSENTPISSLSLLNTNESDFGSYAPVNFDKYSTKKKYHIKKNKYDDSDESESDLSSESLQNSRCSYSVKHLKKCDRCYNKLKKIVNTKVNKKFDEIILETKMKQLQNATLPQTQIIQPFQPLQNHLPQQPQNITTNGSESWKETLIIVIGAIIAIFIIFLIVKALNK